MRRMKRKASAVKINYTANDELKEKEANAEPDETTCEKENGEPISGLTDETVGKANDIAGQNEQIDEPINNVVDEPINNVDEPTDDISGIAEENEPAEEAEVAEDDEPAEETEVAEDDESGEILLEATEDESDEILGEEGSLDGNADEVNALAAENIDDGADETQEADTEVHDDDTPDSDTEVPADEMPETDEETDIETSGADEEIAEEEETAEEEEADGETEDEVPPEPQAKPEKEEFRLTAPANLEEILANICVKRGRKLIYRPNEIIFNCTATVTGTDKDNEEGIKVKNILDEEIRQGVKLGYIDKYDGLKMSEIKEEYENDIVYEYAEQEFKRTGLVADGDKIKVYIYDWDMKALHHVGYVAKENVDELMPYLKDREKYSFDICGLITGGKFRKVIKDEASGKVTVEKGNDGKLGMELDISVINRKD